MDREITPIEYLPEVMQEVKEVQELYKGITPELRLIAANEQALLDECFVNTAESVGLERLETMLKIKVQTGDTIADRRLRILTKLNGDTPYTFGRIYDKLKQLCGEDNVEMYYAREYYTLHVGIKLPAKNQFDTIKDMLHKLLPCNISLICAMVYNRHRNLKPFTHSALRAYTFNELRENVIS